jgi:FkbM family methyltransferase
MSSPGVVAERARGLRIGHRVRALRGASATVCEPRRMVAAELALLPLRPVAFALARVLGTSPGEAWRALTRPLGGGIGRHTLRGSGRRIHVRRGTPDIFTLYETHAAGLYEPPPEAALALARRGAAPRVMDLGGNIGLFALFALGRWPGATVTSYEPDPANLEVLRRTAQANADAGWHVVEAGAGCADGAMDFLTGHFAVSRAASPSDKGTVRVPVRDVLPGIASCDLMKMDIEGGEWPILADARLAQGGPAAVVMEYHSWGCPGPDPEAAARAALEAAGLRVGPALADGVGSGTLWAWLDEK